MKYTYETKDTTNKIETFEWDDIWLEHADDNVKPRVMIIGDSISCGYRKMITEEFDERVLADGIGTSKAIDNEFYFQLIDYVFAQEKHREVIQFNCGLHGWHLTIEEYGKYYEKMINWLAEKYGKENLIVALSTPVRKNENLAELDIRNETIQERNRIVTEIAKKCHITINDFYSRIIDKPEIWSADGIHLTETGYRFLAKQTVCFIRKKLDKQKIRT